MHGFGDDGKAGLGKYPPVRGLRLSEGDGVTPLGILREVEIFHRQDRKDRQGKRENPEPRIQKQGRRLGGVVDSICPHP